MAGDFFVFPMCGTEFLESLSLSNDPPPPPHPPNIEITTRKRRAATKLMNNKNYLSFTNKNLLKIFYTPLNKVYKLAI